MSLSPWDVGTVFSFDFAVYQPRRHSFLQATRSRHRPSSYRRAMRQGMQDSEAAGEEGEAPRCGPGGEEVNTTDAEGSSIASGVNDEAEYIEQVMRRQYHAETSPDLAPQAPSMTPFYRPPTVDRSPFVPQAAARPEGHQERPQDEPGSEEVAGVELSPMERFIPGPPAPDANHLHAHPNHPHKHNITIALNDEPIDRIKTRCTSPVCQHKTGQKGEVVCRACESSSLRYKRNLVLLCVGFILVYTSFRAVQNLQTTLNDSPTQPYLGTLAMFAVYLSMFLSCLVIPVYTQKINAKWCIMLGLLCYIAWLSANIQPAYPYLIPVSVLLGVGQSLAWNAQVVYLAKLSRDFYETNRQAASDIFKWNALFLACFQSTHVWGNLAASLLLGNKPAKGKTPPTTPTPSANVSGGDTGRAGGNLSAVLATVSSVAAGPGVPVAAALDAETHGVLAPQKCGRFYCRSNHDLSVGWRQVQGYQSMITTQIVMACTGIILVICFLQNIRARSDTGRSAFQILKSNCSHLCLDKTFRLLIPLLIFNGFEQGFIYTDYNQSYVACPLGVRFIGYNMIALGLVSALGSIVMGLVAFRLPREAIMGLTCTLQMGIFIFLLIWEPQEHHTLPMFVISGLWGLCDAVWQTQCNVLIGIGCYEDSETAFINFRLLQAFGAALAFALNLAFCPEVRMYMLMALLVLSMLTYVPAEVRIRKSWRTVARQQVARQGVNEGEANGDTAIDHPLGDADQV